MVNTKIFLCLLSTLVFFSKGDSASIAPTLPPICALVLCLAPDCDNPLPPPPGGCCPFCPLKCPKLPPDTFGICVERCSANDDCPKGQLCCSNGCGHECMDGVSDVCVHNGQTYLPGETFPAGDGCNTCTCTSGGLVACTKKACLCPVKGQVFKECGSACPANCTIPNPICTKQCVPRCECPSGEVIDEASNTCVPKDKCPSTCPPDKPMVFCFVDPCQFAQCPNHPNAVCVADYCGGCNARFFVGKKEVTDTCSSSTAR